MKNIFTIILINLLGLFCTRSQAQVAGFTVDNSSGCAPLTVHFHSTSTGASSYSWDFGNGTPFSALADASSTYHTVGSYTVTLTAYNSGLTDSNKHSMVITVYPKPTASFYSPDTAECPGSTISFISTSIAGMPGPMTYNWTFGDGNAGIDSFTSDTYIYPGHYTVSLEVTNGAGCTSDDTALDAYIHIFTPANVAFDAPDSFFCKAPGTVSFNNTTTGFGSLTYLWRFGDGGSSSSMAPSYTYSIAGNYTVSLIVTDGHSCTDSLVSPPAYISLHALTAAFTAPVNKCLTFPDTFYNTSSSHVSCVWTFGDGFTTTDDAVIHTYTTSGAFNVRLVVFDGLCYDTVTHTVNIIAPPTGNYIRHPLVPCNGALDTFTASVSPGCMVHWLWGDGDTSSGLIVSRVFPQIFYPVAYYGRIDFTDMIMTNSYGCVDTFQKIDTIYNMIFSVTNAFAAGQCLPEGIDFGASLSSNLYNALLGRYISYAPAYLITSLPYPYPITSYSWNFGDGSPLSTIPDPLHTYTAYGGYMAICNITTANGCSDSSGAGVTPGGPPPVATFTMSSTHQCAGSTVTLTASETGVYNSLKWSFGDGSQAAPGTLTEHHTYTTPGLDTIKFWAYFNGCSNLPTVLVDTVDSPNAVMHLTYDCNPRNTVTFGNSSYGADSVLWIFGDGSTSRSLAVTHPYPALDSYRVLLTTYNRRSGCRDTASDSLYLMKPTVITWPSDSAICKDIQLDTFYSSFTSHLAAVDYDWYVNGSLEGFADTMFVNFFHTWGSTPVTLVITDSHGCPDSATFNLLVAKPIDSFGIAPPTGCAPAAIDFTDYSTDAAGAAITRYFWSFGYGDTSSVIGPDPVKTFASGGVYSIEEIVTDNIGCKDTLYRSSAVSVLAPASSFRMDTSVVCAGVYVLFTNTSTGIVRSLWIFGDGDTSSATSPYHIFTIPGSYTIRLVGYDSLGCNDTFSLSGITVNPSPHSSFYMDDSLAVCPPLTVNFTNTSTGALSSGYRWYFGDGDSSVAFDPSWFYEDSGYYTVLLVSRNSYNCTDTAVGHASIFGYPGDFTYTPVDGCSPMLVRFTGRFSSDSVSSVIWDFGDGVTYGSSLADTISHTYAIGAYVPKLILASSRCPTTYSVGADTIKADTLTPAFAVVPDTVCSNNPVSFRDSSFSVFSRDTGWYWWFGSGATASTSAPIYTYSIAGTYPVTLTVTNAYGCSRMITKDVTVNASPSPIAGVLTLCAGTATSLSDSVPGGIWSASGSGVLSIGSASGLVTGLSAGTATVRYQLSGGCTVTAVVVVNASPSVIVGGAVLCTGARINLTDSVPGGRWSGSNGLVAGVGSTTGVVTGISAGTSVITYKLSAGGGCFSTQTVTVNAFPSAILLPVRVCTYSSEALYDSTAGGAWSSGNPLVAAIGSATGIVTGIAAGTAVITYSTGIGCVTVATVTVSRFSPITGVASACAGNSTTLGNTSAGGVWSSGNVGIAVVGAGSGVVTGVSAGTVIISYTLGGCSAVAAYSVNPLPVAITGSAGVCNGFSTVLTDSSSGGTWSSGSPGVATIIPGTGYLTGVTLGTAVITYTLPTGCRITAMVSVGPLPPAISGDSSVCAGLAALVDDAGTGGAWSSGNTGIAVIGSVSGIVTGVSAGTAGITYMLNGCPVSKIFRVNPLPSGITGGYVCAGFTTILTDTAIGGTWSSGATGIAGIGSSTGVVTGISAGIAVITYKLGTGCIATFIDTTRSAPPAITGPVSLCAGDSVTLGDGGSGGAWSSGYAEIAVIGSGTGIVTGVLAGTAVISYEVNGCPATRRETINPEPGLIIGPDSMCAGGAIIHLYDSTSGGLWTSSLVTVDDTTGVVTGYLSGVGIVTYTLGTGCFITGSITVLPLPGLISGQDYVCADSTTTFSDATGGGLWSSPDYGLYVTVGSSTGDVTGIATGNAIITYRVPAGCISTKTISVNPVPLPISGDSAICVGLTMTLWDTTYFGTGYWSSGTGAVATIGSVSGVVTGVSAGTAIITYLAAGTCVTSFTTKVVTVMPVPVAGMVTGDSIVCAGNDIVLTDTLGWLGTWSSSNGSATVSGGMVHGVYLGVDTIIYSVINACETVTAVKTVTIDSLPQIGAITGAVAVCVGSAITLGDATPSGSWSSSNISATVSGGAVTGVFQGTAIISYSVSGYCGTAAVTHSVTVEPLPDTGKITGDTALCNGLTTALRDTAEGGVWSSGNSSLAVVGSSGVVTGLNPGEDTIYYSVTNICGTGRAKFALAISPSPQSVHIVTFADSTLCTNTLFQNFGTDTVAPAGEYYTWSATNGEVYASSPDKQNCLVNFNTPGPCVIKLTAGIAGTDCYTADSITYNVGSILTPDPAVVYYEPELVCTDNTAASYQWGYDNAVTLDSTILPGEINQNYYNANLDLPDKYYWVLTYHYGCIQKSYYNTPLAVNLYTAGNKFKVILYPNPADDKLNITIQGISKPGAIEVKLYDVLGQQIRTCSIAGGTGSIPLAGCASGVYMVKIMEYGETIGTGTFIKN